MPRCDSFGRELQAVLGYELNRPVAANELHRALGVARNTYYARYKEDNFPNPEECRRLAEYFDISFGKLLLVFEYLNLDELNSLVDDPSTGGLGLSGVATQARPRRRDRKGLAAMPRRTDTPRL